MDTGELVVADDYSKSGRHYSTATVRVHGKEEQITGEGNGPVSAFMDALETLGVHASVLDYSEHGLDTGSDQLAAAYVECEVRNGKESQVVWGAGIDPDITTASL